MRNYNITDEEIAKAEQDILENGAHFNVKQREFIRCFNSCCMQAYAGTGKTAAIVGKLHVLAQKNARQNGRGICVISHTNVAVDEIKKHVAKHYPAIMQYPNFVGTIQEFINKFLFIPYLADRGLKIRFQDESRHFNKKDIQDPLVLKRVEDKDKQLNHSPNVAAAKRALNEKLKTLHISDGRLCATKDGEFNEFTDLTTKAVSQEQITTALCAVIEKKQDEGYFLFVESFIYGNEYLKKQPILKDALSRRFQLVLLDEAQDCSDVQLQILNNLFGDGTKNIFQQVGDVNQAISETKRKPDAAPLTLDQSTRFGDNLAAFINKFKVDEGTGVTGTTQTTKKYLIKYDADKRSDVIQKFAEIVEQADIPTDKAYFAISHQHDQLANYCPTYSEKLAKNKNKKASLRFSDDIEYVELLTKDALFQQGSYFISKVLTSLLYKHLKEDCSWVELREELRYGEKSADFRKMILIVSNELLNKERISDLSSLQNELNDILGENKTSFSISNSYINAKQSQVNDNKYRYNETEICVGTIHSVKGQTHNATLLFSNSERRKQDVQHTIDNTPILGPFFKKRLYVGSSRAKHLFAFAIEKNAFNSVAGNDIFRDFEQVEV